MNAVLLLILGMVIEYARSYATEKGKNVASKEDVAEITTLIESVKNDFQVARDREGHTNSLRLVATERRLAALQEAYGLWRRVGARLHAPQAELNAAVGECQEWWNANCLYLDKDVREAFFRAYMAAAIHRELVAEHPRTAELAKIVIENRELINAAGDTIVRAAALPPLSGGEAVTTAVLATEPHVEGG